MSPAPRGSYGERLSTLTAARGRLCVGIDPHPGILQAWGLPLSAQGLEQCARTMVEALGETVAVFKPQSALFEEYGSAGIRVLETVLADIAQAGAMSILDTKRGDIGSTMEGYARAYLRTEAPLAADAITLSPYLGYGSLEPAITMAVREGRGVYVLARTSNPEGDHVQLARGGGGTCVAQQVVEQATADNAELITGTGAPIGPVGLVVGATRRDTGLTLDDFNGSLLVPGIGAQGGAVEDLPVIFGAAADQVLASVSRAVLGAGPDHQGLREAAAAQLPG